MKQTHNNNDNFTGKRNGKERKHEVRIEYALKVCLNTVDHHRVTEPPSCCMVNL